MVNALNPDGALINTVPHATTPALMAPIVFLMVGSLAGAIRQIVLLRMSVTVAPVQRRMTGLRLALQQLVCSRHGRRLLVF